MVRVKSNDSHLQKETLIQKLKEKNSDFVKTMEIMMGTKKSS